ncbi:MAG: protein adenylyltransferase SelO family protein, partial [Nitrososphaeraceae archaeon]|nr:protein adenylyltransferase SelO family protein [Nitrososphaeraceae archaeon]
MNSISNLNFHNTAVNELPVDPIKQNYVRWVPNCCLSLVDPTPVQNPQLVHYSTDALSLIDLDSSEFNKHQLTFYFSGNDILPGSIPYASCYCGHQFKIFAGALGDGRAITFGEIVNNKGERWELQLKGAGKTPFSRKGDGRAALRSSIREYLCSEFMYYLGIPTTRAASIVTSDTLIERDINYDGNVIQEKASIISRLAPTFIRFGSFQISDPMGPSEGNKEIIHTLLKYVIKYHFPHIYSKSKSLEQMTLEFADEVCLKTATIVAMWQAVGFTHGVLNTDNMSILGICLDFGPFGFMDNFDPDFVPNTSDKEGRYRFSNQSNICKWNLQ